MKPGDLIKLKHASTWIPTTKRAHNDGVHSVDLTKDEIGLLIKFIGARPGFYEDSFTTYGLDYWIVFVGNGCYYISEDWMKELNNK